MTPAEATRSPATLTILTTIIMRYRFPTARVLALGVLAWLVATPVAAQTSNAPRSVTGVAVARLIPGGAVTAQVMEIGAPPRFAELSARLQAAMRKDPAWFAAHVQAARPGEPLSYDARMGITAAEYRDLLALADSMAIRPVSPVELRVVPTPTGWRLEGGTALPELQGVEIDTVAWEVRTPFGVAKTVKAISANPDQRATGPWDGVQWQHQDPSLAAGNGTMATFALGRLAASGRGLLYYDARRAAGGALTERVTRILTFDLPR